jgi:Single-strand binding protein family
MGSQPTLDPAPTRPPATDQEQHPDPLEDRAALLHHLQTPAAFGGHEFGDWPEDQIANGFGGDLHARHRHDHTRLAHEFGHTHPDLQRDAVRDAEEAFDRLSPDYGVPADQHNPYGKRAVQDREAALALGSGWPSTTAARTIPTRSSGSPARTTGSPTPSTPPAPSPPGRVGARSGSAPNAKHQHEGAELMAADNHTIIVGNLVEDPELRFTNTGTPVANLRVAVTQRINKTASGATATPRSSRSTCATRREAIGQGCKGPAAGLSQRAGEAGGSPTLGA